MDERTAIKYSNSTDLSKKLVNSTRIKDILSVETPYLRGLRANKLLKLV